MTHSSIVSSLHTAGFTMFLLGLAGLVLVFVLAFKKASSMESKTGSWNGLITLGSILLILVGGFLAFCVLG